MIDKAQLYLERMDSFRNLSMNSVKNQLKHPGKICIVQVTTQKIRSQGGK